MNAALSPDINIKALVTTIKKIIKYIYFLLELLEIQRYRKGNIFKR